MSNSLDSDVIFSKLASALHRGDTIAAKDLMRDQANVIREKLGDARYFNDLAVLEMISENSSSTWNELEAECNNAVVPELYSENLELVRGSEKPRTNVSYNQSRKRRIGILSLLFNWPSTGGGTIHTAELSRFLAAYGYEVCHFSIRYEPWGIGGVDDPLHPVRVIEFDEANWNADQIVATVRSEVDQFMPDHVIVTDSWNFKPLLAKAVESYPFIMRFAALECLCPLNNVRLLINESGTPICCPSNQLSDPQRCHNCVSKNGKLSGQLHQLERELAGYGGQVYDDLLRWALRSASGVFVVNPLIAEMFKPHSHNVQIVPSGFDENRFPKTRIRTHGVQECYRILFAGLADEYMKGFHVLIEAATRLWQERQDFTIVVTGEAPPNQPPWAEYVGWQSQDNLPKLMSECDLLVFPTIAEEALGRSAVEAGACGLPVVASRIGGLQFVISEDANGLLFTPGDATELAKNMKRLIENSELRASMGQVGRQRFLRELTWNRIIPDRYEPLLGSPLKVLEEAFQND